MQQREDIRIAILDLYNGTENLGMRGIFRIVSEVAGEQSYDVFDVRQFAEVPDLSYDIYIFSGGPGDPRVAKDSWGPKFYGLLDDLWKFNKEHPGQAKHILNICHSFQMVCHHFGIGEVTDRKSQSFGVFPVHKTEAGKKEWLFKDLDDPFYIADFRFYQLVQPNEDVIAEMGAEILLLEKIRPHVPLERAVMGVRLSPEWIAVQFHPEADPAGMIEHFYKKKIKEKVLEIKGQEKFELMIEALGDPDKLEQTHKTVIPMFLKNAITDILTRNESQSHTRRHRTLS